MIDPQMSEGRLVSFIKAYFEGGREELMKSQFLFPTRTGSVVTGQSNCELVLPLLITFMQLSSSYYFEITVL